MILRKPYAFLIKYFRLIHFIIALFMSYIMICTWNVLDFFNNYISSGQVVSTFEDISAKYVSSLFLIVVSFVIVVLAVILYLMKHKKKPSFYYIFSLICYSVLLVLLLFSSNFIYELQFYTPDLRITKLLRDVYLALFLLQIFNIVIPFVRAIGFDIKKFDFRKDIMDFEVSSADNEEFEFELGIDTEDIRAKVRKKIRFFKYYYKENKVIFFGAFIICAVVIVINVANYINSKETIYKEQEFFDTRMLQITVLDSYKTSLDYKGNEVNSNYFYVILKLRYKNKTNDDFEIIVDNARLGYDKYESVTPTKLVYNKFVEFGVPYYSQILKGGETRDFILVYEVKKEYYNSDFMLKYLYNTEIVNNQIDYKYRNVILAPEEVDDFAENATVTKKLGEELTFTDSLLGETKLTINNIDISNKYTYNVKYCKNGDCSNLHNFLQPTVGGTYELTLMRINYKLSYDNRLGQGYSISSFIEKFGSIRFVVNGKEYEHKIDLKDVTPYPTNGYVYLEVRERLNKAEAIYLDFTIRDKKYTYVIKEAIKEDINEGRKEELK